MRTAREGTVSGAGPTDAALVVAARAGEQWAKEALFRRYATRVNRLALRLMGRDSDVDDLVQDSFVQAFSSLNGLRHDVAFESWLSSVVCQTAYKMLRKRTLLRRLGLHGTPEPIDFDGLLSHSASPEQAAEVTAFYRRADTWPAKIRIPCLLKWVEGASISEIAEWTDTSPATVKRRLAEGAELLQQYADARSER
jgi:RNA polymerase sigma-70 factor (ECF subfamily)